MDFFLKKTKHKVLDISHNYISDIGAIELGSGVGNAEALKEVNIGKWGGDLVLT